MTAVYEIEYTESFVRRLKKLDKQTQRIVMNWITKNLKGTIDPRIHGKPLKGNLSGIWRYRVGDYRIFARIEDGKMIVFLFDIGHRREVYRKP